MGENGKIGGSEIYGGLLMV